MTKLCYCRNIQIATIASKGIANIKAPPHGTIIVWCAWLGFSKYSPAPTSKLDRFRESNWPQWFQVKSLDSATPHCSHLLTRTPLETTLFRMAVWNRTSVMSGRVRKFRYQRQKCLIVSIYSYRRSHRIDLDIKSISKSISISQSGN